MRASAGRLAATVAASVLVALLPAGLLVGQASAAPSGAAPVTQPDRLAIWAGGHGTVDAAANDSDPDGDRVAVCRIGRLPRGVSAFIDDDGALGIGARPVLARTTVRVTYFACDRERLTPGVVTVRVRREPRVSVRYTSPRGTAVRVVNAAPFPVMLHLHEYGDGLTDEGRTRRLRVDTRTHRVVRVDGPFFWSASNQREQWGTGGELGVGRSA